MSDRRLMLSRAGVLAKRELRSIGTWALACGSLAYALWSTWSGGWGTASNTAAGPVGPGLLSISSWLGVLVMVTTVLLPLWIIERIASDQESRWFEPLFVVGWRREAYLLSLFAVLTGLGTACFLLSVLSAGAFAFSHGGRMPAETVAGVVAAIPTFLAAGAAGLLLGTLFRDRALALSVAVLGIAIPMVVSALYVFNLDRLPPAPLRALISIHLPPIRTDTSAPWLLYKVAYASGAMWISLVIANRRVGRRR